MVYNAKAHICSCDESSVVNGGGCDACPQGMVPAGSKCACPAGTKDDGMGACVHVAGLGDACDGATMTCLDTTYDVCGIRAGRTAGICTKGCKADGDCGDAYTCADWEASPFCLGFSGTTKACTTPADCAGQDASICFNGVCRIPNCTVTTDHTKEDCPKELVCCDVSFLGVPGVNSACVKPGMVPKC